MRWLRWIGGIVWIFSWYTIYLEVFRWHHMTKSLRFNPPPPPPVTDIQVKAVMPLVAVCLGSAVAPLVFLTALSNECAPGAMDLRVKRLAGLGTDAFGEAIGPQDTARNRGDPARQPGHGAAGGEESAARATALLPMGAPRNVPPL
jgi:hypothetical protein